MKLNTFIISFSFQ